MFSKKVYNIAVFFAIGVVLLVAVQMGCQKLLTYYWYESLGYADVFIRLLKSQALNGLVFFVFAGLVLAVNMGLARRHLLSFGNHPRILPGETSWFTLVWDYKAFHMLFWVACASFACYFAVQGTGGWFLQLRMFNSTPFASVDPVFHINLGFYVFEFPYIQYVTTCLLWLLVFILGATTLYYLAGGAIWFELESIGDMYPDQAKNYIFKGLLGLNKEARVIQRTSQADIHVRVILSAILLVLAVSMRLNIYALLWSHNGSIWGIGYTDEHVRIPSFWFTVFTLLTAIVLIWVGRCTRRVRVLMVICCLSLIAFLFDYAAPQLVQSLIVKPNELDIEAPYIAKNIEATRWAFELNTEEALPPGQISLTSDQFIASLEKNAPLWDLSPLTTTFKQLQEIQPLYNFPSLSLDCLRLDGQLHQIAVASRNIFPGALPEAARNWVNLRLRYTHGYGAAVCPVSVISKDGQPQFWLKDIPATSTRGLFLRHPQIYYGLGDMDYVFVNTTLPEFDYPKGTENVYTKTTEHIGIPLDSLFKRIVASVVLMDARLIASEYLTDTSQLLINRNVTGRVTTLAPFMALDSQPYLTFVDGEMYWIFDAYTQSSTCPYSQPYQGGDVIFSGNYMRNTVKVVVNTFSGKVDFYTFDDNEPVLKTMKAIFPTLFKPASQMPENFKDHLRYPFGLFQVQSSLLRDYHMSQVQSFFSREDAWDFATQVYSADATLTYRPYYSINRFSADQPERYTIMIPYTPLGKPNMTSWLAGYFDPATGKNKLVLEQLPKDSLTFGPIQIESRIDQKPEIAQQLSLWNQQGARVIRGNILIFPFRGGFVYVEPVYLEAKKGGLPELKRVIAVSGDNISMREQLDEALRDVLGLQASDATMDTQRILEQARQILRHGSDSLRQGNWCGFGTSLDALDKVLQKKQ